MPSAMANDQDGSKAGSKKKVPEKLSSFVQGKTSYKGVVLGAAAAPFAIAPIDIQRAGCVR